MYDLPPTNDDVSTLRGNMNGDETSKGENDLTVGVRASKGTSSPSDVYTLHTEVTLELDDTWPPITSFDPTLNLVTELVTKTSGLPATAGVTDTAFVAVLPSSEATVIRKAYFVSADILPRGSRRVSLTLAALLMKPQSVPYSPANEAMLHDHYTI